VTTGGGTICFCAGFYVNNNPKHPKKHKMRENARDAGGRGRGGRGTIVTSQLDT
jgi:hypothetical protein